MDECIWNAITATKTDGEVYILSAKYQENSALNTQTPTSDSQAPGQILTVAIMAPIATDPSEAFSHLSVSEDLVPSRTEQQSQIVTLNFKGLLNPPLKLQTDVSECGGQLWPAGMVLAEYLLRNKMDELRGKTMFVRSKDFL
jgi:hypothetical protein